MTRFARIAGLLVPALAMASIAGCPATDTTGTTGNTNNTTTTTGSIKEFLPSSITLDVSDLPASQSSASNPTLSRGLAGGAREIVDMFQDAGDIMLAIGDQITNDITSVSQAQVGGKLTIGSTTVEYKCDFSKFDFNGDGVLDGSGNSQATPVAFRVWTDKGAGYEQFMCGLITALPTSGNAGAGTIVARPFAGSSTAAQDQQMLIEWDRTILSHQWNQAYVAGTVDSSRNVTLSIGHAHVDVRSTGTLKNKTVRGAGVFSSHPAGYSGMQSSVVYQQGGSAMLLSAQAVGGATPASVDNACISLSDFNDATGSACSSFDTQDMTFLDLPVGGENAFPAGFAPTPTF
ncbi:MAG: hypothetical protein U1D55_12445 [Phycisphaerae bacterium]